MQIHFNQLKNKVYVKREEEKKKNKAIRYGDKFWEKLEQKKVQCLAFYL
jgi:hypothetical protein